MKTDSTQWSQLSAQIEKYKMKAKEDLKKYEKQKFNILYGRKKQANNITLVSKEPPIRFGYSMNLIRDKLKEEESRTMVIKSRISFLRTQRDRKIQSAQRAKNKLQNVLAIRNTNAIEKKILEKECSSMNNESLRAKKQIYQRARSQRNRISIERQRMLSQNSLRAKRVKEQQKLNQSFIAKQRESLIARRQKTVKHIQKELDASIKNKKQRQKEIVNDGIRNHQIQISKEFQNLQNIQKLNRKIVNYFNHESRRIMEQTERAERNLKEFSYLLMAKGAYKAKKFQQKFSPDLKSTKSASTYGKNKTSGNQKPFHNFFHLTN